MKRNPFLCFLLCIALLLPIVPVINGAAAPLPEIDTVIYSNDFLGDTIDEHIVKTGGNGTLEQIDGELVLTRTATAVAGVNASDSFQIYCNPEKTAVDAPLTAVSFSIARSESKLFTFGIYDADGIPVTTLEFTADSGVIRAQYADEDGGTVTGMVHEQDCTGSEIQVTYACNQIARTFSLWFDDTLVLQDAGYLADSGNLCSIGVQLEKRNNMAVSMRKLQVFTYAASSEELVEAEKQALLFSDISAEEQDSVTTDLHFITTGRFGCDIVWQTSDPAVIAEDGTVTRSADGDSVVTVTAVISKDGTTATKSFEVTVKQLILTQMPAVKDILLDDSAAEHEFGVQSPYTYDLGTATGSILGMQFTVSSTGQYGFQVAGEKGTALEVNRTGQGLAVKAADGTEEVLARGVPDTAAYTLLLDVITNTFSLWMGNDKVAALAVASAKVPTVERVIFEQSEGGGTVSGFSAFYPVVPSDDAIGLDYQYLTFDKLSYQSQDGVTTDLHLKTTGRAGSTIEWSSSDPSVLSDDGVVNSSRDASVTLTAVISNGDGQPLTKTFDIHVAQWEKDEVPEVKNMIFEETFDNNSISSTWNFTPESGEIVAEEEGLYIKRWGNGTETIADLYMDSSQTVYQGVYALEYTVSRKNKTTFFMYTYGSGQSASLTFLADGSVQHIPAGNWVSTPVVTTDDAVKFTILYNTLKSLYTVYVNDKMIIKDAPFRQAGNGIGYMRMYLGGADVNEVKVDNIRFYESYLLSEDRVNADYAELSDAILVNEDDAAFAYGMVSQDLLLPTVGQYGSSIEWSSSDESLISSQGAVSYAVGENDTAVLTATISSGQYYLTKTFSFKVVRQVGSDEEVVSKDAELINFDTVAPSDDGNSQIRQSLNLLENGVYGSTVSWTSSDTRYITASGRVIRPRWYEQDAPVTMTATISYGAASITRSLDFTVLKDEEWKDPQYMTDAEFFGVWDGNAWTQEGKLNYAYPGMEPVGEAVKAGDIELAKIRLQEYYANRPAKTAISMASRNTRMANALVDDFYTLIHAGYFQGEFTVGDQWEKCEAEVGLENISPGAVSTFGVRAWYNESSSAEIKRYNDPNVQYRPRLELIVNGALRTFWAVDDISVRAGAYKNVNYNDTDILKVQTFGAFLGDNTRQAAIKFDFSDLKDSDVVTSAKLVLYAKASGTQSEKKRMIVLRDPTITWDSETATWNSFDGFVYSYNGLPGKNDWLQNPPGANAEYQVQMARFPGYSSAVIAEYLATRDETYMYKMLSIINDFIVDTGNYTMKDPHYMTYDPDGLRGGWSRTIDVCAKNNEWMRMIEVIAGSKTTTPELFTSILKNLWDSVNFLTVYQTDSGNWRTLEYDAILNASVKMPEFTDALSGKNWRKMGQTEAEANLFLNHTDDGACMEGATNYNVLVFNSGVSYKSSMESQGVSVTPEYDELLHKMAYYNVMLYTPDGQDIQFGDSPSAQRNAANFLKVAQWYNDKELEFIASNGQRGIEPEWTSKSWPIGLDTVMRADWTVNSPYLFTSVHGRGTHSHTADNNVIVSAYGRILLNDAGTLTYTQSDPLWAYSYSSEAHNTVLVNDTSQVYNGRGVIHDFTTNASYDFVSQTTSQNPGIEHRRTITFIKPEMWIVSDLMQPEDITRVNNYKQSWHMLPSADLAVSQEDRTIYSNYTSGANIIVANADGTDAELKKDTGWYGLNYGQIQEAPYGYFEKNSAGDVTFDTVLMPSNNDPTASVTAQKLPTADNATALRIDFTQDGQENTGYYYMSYSNQPGEFGAYQTDGEVAFVQENADGKITYMMIKNGKYLKDSTGKYLVHSDTLLTEFAVNITGSSVSITTGENTDLSQTVIALDADMAISRVSVNEVSVSYTVSDGLLSDIGSGTTTGGSGNGNVPSYGIDDTSKGQGGTGGGSTGGGGAGGGGTGGGGTGGAGIDQPENPESAGFPDVAGHWAEPYANDLKERGIVIGDTEGQFHPDSMVTRAEFIAMAARAMGLDQTAVYQGQFSDVSASDWYAGVVQAALDQHLISPDEVFRPDDAITRQEMAKIIGVTAQIAGKFGNLEITSSSYADGEDIADWAKEYVDFASSSGLMNGMEDHYFRPLKSATRGEAAAVISRFLESN